MLVLCLDGSLNGKYVSAEAAVIAGYEETTWPNGESVWVEAGTDMEQEWNELDESVL